jgi:hypothetical protein
VTWSQKRAATRNKKPILDQTLYKAKPGGLWNYNGGTNVEISAAYGAFLGYRLVDTSTNPNVASDCTAAVNLLNKCTVDKCSKMASDPGFNLAAQLLAAELNLVSGAGFCAETINAVYSAEQLLGQAKFNGLSDKMTAAQATSANSLATTLNNYNNDMLCP